MKKQKIFYYYRKKKVIVKSEPLITKYEVKLNDRELFVFEIKDFDNLYNRAIINSYIDRLTEYN